MFYFNLSIHELIDIERGNNILVNARRVEIECNPEHLFLRMIQFRNLQVISFENKFKLERRKPQKSSYFVLI